ncbi:MAG: KdsC family phosphatase [Phycisphaerae bacterium]
MDLRLIDVLILDVDGVLTSGQVGFDDAGPTGRTFAVQDGCALKLWHQAGGVSAIVSGRKSQAVARRADELGIKTVIQGVDDKSAAYGQVLERLERGDDRVCYVGDDLPDSGPMGACALPVAVYNAVPAVKGLAQYVTRRPGGGGAVAEVVELILRKQGRWTDLVARMSES